MIAGVSIVLVHTRYACVHAVTHACTELCVAELSYIHLNSQELVMHGDQISPQNGALHWEMASLFVRSLLWRYTPACMCASVLD